ncbi:MAG: DNA repair protein RadC [Bacteroidetes bacterium]|nr:DNA repair protein RadC [Bacteroidota bacterium]
MPDYVTLKNRHADEQPREKFEHLGRNALSNSELIGILLGTGSKSKSAIDLARDALNLADNSLHSLARMTVADLCRIEGIGPAKAISVLSALELGARRASEEIKLSRRIGSSREAYQYMSQYLQDKPYEEFWVILLSRSNRLIKEYKISEGSISGTVADPRKIYKLAIDRGASGIILCHNHPSGNLKPSTSDMDLTRKVKLAGEMLDIQVLDHIIVSSGGYYSFADDGKL